MWAQLETPWAIMLSRQLQRKSIVPHDIIRSEFALPPMLVEALFQLVVFIDGIHGQSQDRLSWLAFTHLDHSMSLRILTLGKVLW